MAHRLSQYRSNPGRLTQAGAVVLAVLSLAWAPWVAFVVCTSIGVFFGIHPAKRAARLDPIEALRTE